MFSSNQMPEPLRAIPAYSLYGEEERFEPPMHLERIADRAPLNDWKIDLHLHPSLTQFLIVQSGTFEATIGATTRSMVGAVLIGLPAGLAHAFAFDQNTQGFVLSLREIAVESHSSRSSAVLSEPVFGSCSDEVIGACIQLHRIQGRKGQGHHELKNALVGQIKASARIMQEDDGMGDATRLPSHRLVRRFEESIEQHLQLRWSVAQHAKTLCVTATHLNRVVKRATGMTASQLIAQATLERAKALLLHTSRSVAEVAFALGYDDPPHFSRRFRCWTGHSPRDWRAIDLQHRSR